MGSDSLYHRSVKLQNTSVMGVEPQFSALDFVYDIKGRFINENDIKNRTRAAVLVKVPRDREETGRDRMSFSVRMYDMDATDFGEYTVNKDMLGDELYINGLPFRIVGELKTWPAAEDFRINREKPADILIPFSTYDEVITGGKIKADVLVSDKKLKGQYEYKLKRLISAAIDKDADQSVYDFDEQLVKREKALLKSLKKKLFLGFVAVTAGGIGIMNVTMAIMFSKEREIGIRRALGASKTDILKQFLAEAGLLGLFGGVAGIVLGTAALIYLTPPGTEISAGPWAAAASMAIALCACLLSVLYPACSAAAVNPAEALRG